MSPVRAKYQTSMHGPVSPVGSPVLERSWKTLLTALSVVSRTSSPSFSRVPSTQPCTSDPRPIHSCHSGIPDVEKRLELIFAPRSPPGAAQELTPSYLFQVAALVHEWFSGYKSTYVEVDPVWLSAYSPNVAPSTMLSGGITFCTSKRYIARLAFTPSQPTAS